MEQLFVPYNLALKLAEKGFNEYCFRYWIHFYKDKKPYQEDSNDAREYFNSREIDNWGILAPLYQQVVEWFREKHNIEVQAASWREGGKIIYIYSVHNILTQKSKYRLDDVFNTYYEALNKAIEKALELI